ncbi:hypothetical protein Pcinc_037839 [Petrolisthes cinctipes]|uniref:Uncharacterized protein n=1 Tax=Petrolisthes cinctipes TaxID=88211 RepID=A0AAE1EKZ0_PETCI|nr:hypothetical protein Pcinc_037839 [Petrolisthes cinctipes]
MRYAQLRPPPDLLLDLVLTYVTPAPPSPACQPTVRLPYLCEIKGYSLAKGMSLGETITVARVPRQTGTPSRMLVGGKEGRGGEGRGRQGRGRKG